MCGLAYTHPLRAIPPYITSSLTEPITSYNTNIAPNIHFAHSCLGICDCTTLVLPPCRNISNRETDHNAAQPQPVQHLCCPPCPVPDSATLVQRSTSRSTAVCSRNPWMRIGRVRLPLGSGEVAFPLFRALRLGCQNVSDS